MDQLSELQRSQIVLGARPLAPKRGAVRLLAACSVVGIAACCLATAGICYRLPLNACVGLLSCGLLLHCGSLLALVFVACTEPRQ